MLLVSTTDVSTTVDSLLMLAFTINIKGKGDSQFSIFFIASLFEK